MYDIDTTVYYQPIADVLATTDYFSFEVWSSIHFAAEDCNCSIKDVRKYTGDDIENYNLVR